MYNTLGWGFLEKVYHNALEIELREQGLNAISKAQIKVRHKGVEVGEYFADFLVEGCVIVELKAVERLAEEHHAQLLNYSTTCVPPTSTSGYCSTSAHSRR